MYVWEKIDDDELTLLTPYGDGPVPLYPIVDNYIEFFIKTLNDRLKLLREENAGIGYFQLVFEKKTSENEVKDLGMYCYDFHIYGKVEYGEYLSRGYRIQIKIKNSSAKVADIGVRVLPKKSDDKLVWHGEKLSGKVDKGDFRIFAGYSINETTTQAQKTPPRGFVEGNKKNKKRPIRGKVCILVTEHNLCIFSHKDKYPGNIISFLMFRHTITPGKVLYIANGWRCDDTNITESTLRDKYFHSGKPTKPDVKPNLWLREIWLTDSDGADVRWILPNVYNTNENKMQSSIELAFRHVNQSTGEQEERESMSVIANTFLTKSVSVLSFL